MVVVGVVGVGFHVGHGVEGGQWGVAQQEVLAGGLHVDVEHGQHGAGRCGGGGVELQHCPVLRKIVTELVKVTSLLK